MRKHYIPLLLTLLVSISHYSQIGIGTTHPSESSALDINSTGKGLLVPRMNSVERDLIQNPAIGLIIYNISTQCNEYYTGTSWYNLCWQSDRLQLPTSNGSAIVEGYNCDGVSEGNLVKSVAPIGVTQAIIANVVSAGSYDIKSVINGITFSSKGEFSSTGYKEIVLLASGLPQEVGIYSFAINTVPNCYFERTVNNSESGGTSLISISSCSSASRGMLIKGTEIRDSVEQELTVDVQEAGTYNIRALSDGVLFSGTGDLELGTGVKIVLKASGTPTTAGVSVFSLQLLPSCNFTRNVIEPIAITKQPVAPTAVCSGKGIRVLSVEAKGSGISYTWRKDGVAVENGNGITGQGTSVLTLTNPGETLSGSYDVELNNGQQVVSSAVTVLVNPSPTITSAPAVERYGTGDVTLSAVSSTGSLKWYASSTSTTVISTSSSLVKNLKVTTTFYVEAVGILCSSPSRTAVVASIKVPSITTEPGGGSGGGGVNTVIICTGQPTYTFTVVSEGAVTYNWRKDGTTIKEGGVFSGQGTSSLTLSNPLAVDSGNYDVVISNDVGSVTSKLTTLTVKNIPTIIRSKNGNISLVTGLATLSATPSAGEVKWYEVETGGEIISTGTTFYTPVLTASKTYYAVAEDSGCKLLNRTAVKAVLDLPIITSQPVSPAVVCSGTGVQTLTVVVEGSGNIVYTWRKGGLALVNGAVVSGQGTATLTLTKPTVSDAGSYDVLISNTIDIVSTSVQVVVNSNPSIVSKTEKTICGTGTATLSVTVSSGDISWWSSATGDTLLGTGVSYTTGELTTTTTYYVDITDTSTGCKTTTRTGVVATVAVTPSIADVANKSRCGAGTVDLVGNATGGDKVRWYLSGSSSYTELGTGSAFTTGNIAEGAYLVYSVSGYNSTSQCESAKKTVTVSATAMPALTTEVNVSSCGALAVDLTATVSNGADRLRWYNPAGIRQELNPTDKYTTAGVSVGSTAKYKVEAYNSVSQCTSAQTEITVTGAIMPTVTPTSADVKRCGTGTVELTATLGAGGDKVRWYNPAGDKQELIVTEKYLTGDIVSAAAAVTYKVSAYNSATKCESSKTGITVSAYTMPSVSTTLAVSSCGSVARELLATVTDGDTQVWYNPAGDRQELILTQKYTAATVAVGSIAKYNVAGYNSINKCESAKTEVTITGTAIPVVTPTNTSVSGCGSLPIDLVAGATGADKVRWYNAAGDMQELPQGDKYTVSSVAIGATVTYNVSAYNSTTLCESAKTAVVVTGTTGPVVTPGKASYSRCGTGTVELRGTVTDGDKIRWYNPAGEKQELDPSAKYITASLVAGATVSYQLSGYNTATGCESAKTTVSVSATTQAVPTVSTTLAVSQCGSGESDLVATAGNGGDQVRWYDSLGATTELLSGSPFTTSTITEGTSATYKVTGLNSSTGCESDKKTVIITANALPTVTITSSTTSRCGAGTISLAATVGGGGNKVRWYKTPYTTAASTVDSGVAFVTDNLVSGGSAIYKVTGYNTATGCETAKSEVAVTANGLPGVTTESTVYGCSTGTVGLVATATLGGDKIKWYNEAGDALTELPSGDKYTTAEIAEGSTVFYKVKGLNSLTTCVSSAFTTVSVTARSLPTLTVSPTFKGCGAGFVSLKAITGNGGNTIKWYTETGTTAEGESASGADYLTKVSIAVGVDAIYRVSGYDSVTKCESAKTNITVSAVALPVVTVSSATASRCGSGIVKLTATTTGGDNVKWYYLGVEKGTVLSGAEFSTAVISSGAAAVIYEAEGYDSVTGCTSSTKKSVSVQANLLPSVVTTSTRTRCSTGTLELTATVADGGDKLQWYNSLDVAQGGLIEPTAVFITGAISAGAPAVTYKVASVNSGTGCESAKSTVSVSASTSIVPVVTTTTDVISCGTGVVNLKATVTDGNKVRWYNAAGVLQNQLDSGSIFITDIITVGSSVIYKVTGYNSSTGCESDKTSVTVRSSSTELPTISTPTAVSYCGTGPGTIKLTATAGNGGTKVRWYSATDDFQGEVESGTAYTANINLALGSNIKFKVTGYNENGAGCESATKTEVLITSKSLPTVSIASTTVSRCGAGTIGLIATASGVNNKVRWYNSSDVQQGLDLNSGTTFTTSVLAIGDTAIYKVASYDILTHCESLKTEVTVSSRALPTVIITETSVSRCGAGTVDLIATAGAGANRIKWYNSAGVQQGPTLDSGVSFTTAIIAVGTPITYKVAGYDTLSNCESSTKEVTVTANELPTVTPTTTSITQCGTTAVSLTANTATGGTMVRWYKGTETTYTEVTSGASFSTGVLAAGSNTFNAAGYNNTTQCESAKTSVSITVNPIPQVVTETAVPLCSTGIASLKATITDGDKARWYNFSDVLQQEIPSGNIFQTAVVASGTSLIYKVSGYNSVTTCVSAMTTVTVTAQNNVAPVVSAPATVKGCGAGVIALRATAVGGDKVRWYDTAGVLQAEVLSGAAFMTTVIAVGGSKTYNVSAYNSITGCESSTVAVIASATSDPTPTVDIDLSINRRCGTGEMQLVALCSGGADKIRWYDAVGIKQGADLDSDVVFTTSIISEGTTVDYKVSSYNTTLGCESPMTVVTLTANKKPRVSPTKSTETRCGSGLVELTATVTDGDKVRWYKKDGTSQILEDEVDSGEKFISSNVNEGETVIYLAAGYNSTTACESATSEVIVTSKVLPTVSVATTNATRCGAGTVELIATAGGGGTKVVWYNQEGLVQGTLNSGDPFVTRAIDLLSTVVYTVAGFDPTTGCESLRKTINVTALDKPTINTETNVTRCGTGTVELKATVSLGDKVKWYDSFGVLKATLLSGQIYTTGIISAGATATFYVEGINTTDNCISNARTTVTIKINLLPTVSTAENVPGCGGAVVELKATATQGDKVRWYDETLETPISTLDSGVAFVAPPMTVGETKIYRVTGYNSTTECESDKRTVTVIATSNPTPVVRIAKTSETRCGTGSIELTATAENANKIQWYDSTSLIEELDSDTVFTTSILNIDDLKNYEVFAYNTTTQCKSAGTTVSVRAYAVPTVQVASTSLVRCGAGTVDLVGTATGGDRVRWYDSLVATTPIGDVNSAEKYTTAIIPEGPVKTYYAKGYNSTTTCESAPTAVTVTISPMPIVTTNESVISCGTGNVELTAEVSNGGNKLTWYNSLGDYLADTISGGIYIGTASSGNTAIYFVEGSNSVSNCKSEQIKITITAKVLPTVITSSTVSSCGTGTVKLIATSYDADQVKWYNSVGGYLATVNSGEAYTTISLTNDTTYMVEAFNTTGSCKSASKTTVSVKINSLPSVLPTKLSEIRCGTGTVGLIANATGGTKVRWYEGADDPRIGEVNNGATFTSPVVTLGTTRIFRVAGYNTTTGCESPLTEVSVTANILPTVSIDRTTENLCGTSSVDLIARAVGGDQVTWYNSADVVQGEFGSGSVFIPAPVPAGTQVIYKVAAYSTATGCFSASKTTVTITANKIPTVVASTVPPLCGVETVDLIATATDGNKVRWYEASGTVPIGEVNSGETFSRTIVIGEAVIYKVSGYDSNSKCESATINVSITANSLPTVTTSTSVANCGKGTVDLVATTASGGNRVRWYTENGTTPLVEIASGEKFTRDLVAGSTAIYKVSGYNNVTFCESAKKTVTIIADALPTVDIPKTSYSICGTGTIDIVASAIGADKLRWYNAADQLQGTVNSGDKFTTASLTEGTPAITYYVEAYSTTSACSSAVKKPISVVANVIPVVSVANSTVKRCGTGTVGLVATVVSGGNKINWYTETGTAHVGQVNSGETFATPILPESATAVIYKATAYNSTTTCESTATNISITVNPLPEVVTAAIVPICGPGSVGLIATVTNGDKIKWYDSADVLQVEINSGEVFTTISLVAGQTAIYKAIGSSTATSCSSLTAKVVNVTSHSPSPVTVTAQPTTTRCGAGQVELTAVATGGNKVRWYDSLGVLKATIDSGTIFLTDAVAVGASITYQVSGYNSDTGCESAKTTVTATATASVSPVISTTAEVYRCDTGTVALTATIVSNGDKIRWYNSSNVRVAEVNSGVAYTTPVAITAGTSAIYRVSGYSNTTGCESLKTEVKVTANILPTVSSTTATAVARCGAGTFSLAATVTNADIIRWYDALDTKVGEVASTLEFTTAIINTSTTYRVEAYNTNGSCISAKTPVVMTINPLPVVTIADTKSVCGAVQVSLIATSVGNMIRWYNSAGTDKLAEIASGAEFKPTVSIGSTIYKVTAYNSSTKCETATMKTVTVTASDTPTISVTTATVAKCGAGTFSLSVATTVGGNQLRWYKGSNTTAEGSYDIGTPFVTEAVAAGSSIVYKVAGYNSTTQCESATRETVTVTANVLPTVSTPSTASRYGSGTVELIATAGNGGDKVKWYKNSTEVGTVISGAAFTTDVITVDTPLLYKAEGFNSVTGCKSETQQTVTVSAYDTPMVNAATEVYRCGTGTVALTATTTDGGLSKVRWYNMAGTKLAEIASGATYTAPSLSEGSTIQYQASAYNTTTLFESAKVTITVRSNVQPTISAIAGGRCGSGTVVLYASTTAGAVIKWYSSGGAELGLGTSFTTPTITSTTTFYAEATALGCTTPARIAVQAILNPSIAVATTTPAARCGAGSITLGATASAGGRIKWYSVATGGTELTLGVASSAESYTISNLTATTTYYVEATADGCSSSARVAVQAVLNPTLAITGAPAVARCGNGTVQLSATAVTGAIVKWYAAPTGGTELGTGFTFTTPSISTTTNYYAEATATGCTPPARTAVQAIMNPTVAISTSTSVARCGVGAVTLSATAPLGCMIKWYSVGTGGTELATGATYTIANLTASTSYYAQALALGCTSPARTKVEAVLNPSLALVNTTTGAACGAGSTTILTVTSAIGCTVKWYAAATGGTELATGVTFTTPAISTTTTYYAQANAIGCALIARTGVIATVSVPPGISTNTPAKRCGSGTLVLSATATSGATIKWYAAITGGTALNTGNSFTTPVLSATTTYYAEANVVGCTPSSRTAVVATVNAIPTVNASSTTVTMCSGKTASLVATTANTGTKVRWYDVETSGTALATLDSGSAYTTAALSASKNYYVTGYNPGTACETALRTLVKVNINTVPTISSVTHGNYCSGVGGMIGATAANGGNQIRWYETNVSTAVVNTSNTGQTFANNVAANRSYYVTAYNSTTGCETATRTVVNITVKTIPSVTSTAGAERCGSGSVTISATPSAGATISWWNAATGGNLLASGNSYSPSVAATTTYYARANLDGCLSASTAVIAKVACYYVNVNVTGLSGTLLLRNNGGNDLSINSNGVKRFSTPTGAGTTYNVTVATNPSGQVCKVASPSGTMPYGDVTLTANCEAINITLPATSGTLDGGAQVHADFVKRLGRVQRTGSIPGIYDYGYLTFKFDVPPGSYIITINHTTQLWDRNCPYGGCYRYLTPNVNGSNTSRMYFDNGNSQSFSVTLNSSNTIILTDYNYYAPDITSIQIVPQ